MRVSNAHVVFLNAALASVVRLCWRISGNYWSGGGGFGNFHRRAGLLYSRIFGVLVYHLHLFLRFGSRDAVYSACRGVPMADVGHGRDFRVGFWCGCRLYTHVGSFVFTRRSRGTVVDGFPRVFTSYRLWCYNVDNSEVSAVWQLCGGVVVRQ